MHSEKQRGPYLTRQRDFTLQAAEKRNRSQCEKKSIWGLSLTQAFDTTGDEEMYSSGAEERQILK